MKGKAVVVKTNFPSQGNLQRLFCVFLRWKVHEPKTASNKGILACPRAGKQDPKHQLPNVDPRRPKLQSYFNPTRSTKNLMIQGFRNLFLDTPIYTIHKGALQQQVGFSSVR